VPASSSSAETSGAWRWDGADLILRVQVQPRARREEFAGLHGDALKVRLTAPPVDGKANAALIAFLAKTFGVAKREVTLLQGETGRSKLVRVARPACLPAAAGIPPRPV
jgi:uncharacterized protein (TIGR00251 family)